MIKPELEMPDQFGNNFFILFKEIAQERQGTWRAAGQIGGMLEDVQKQTGWPQFLTRNQSLVDRILQLMERKNHLQPEKFWAKLNPLLERAAKKMEDAGIDTSPLLSASAPKKR